MRNKDRAAKEAGFDSATLPHMPGASPALLDAAAAPWIARSLAGDRSAERRYEDSLAGLLDRFPARHPMGPHRRWCLVRDAWALAEHRAAELAATARAAGATEVRTHTEELTAALDDATAVGFLVLLIIGCVLGLVALMRRYRRVN